MKRLIIVFLSVILVISSCKLKETPTESETPDIEISIISPNGNEAVPEGSTWEIKWSATNVSAVRIQFTTDNGFSWGSVIDSVKNTGTYNWFPVPNKISNQCKVRISSLDGQANDLSDKVFSIVKNSNESLRLVSPTGSETWEAGTSKQIKWYSSGIDSVKIEYTTNNGQKWNLLTVDKLNTGVYTWSPVPNTPSALTKVRISDAKDGFPSTESTQPFEILPEASVTVLSPNGGEELNIGASFSIKWQSVNIENVKLEYTSNGGATWNTIVASTESDGLYIWNPIPIVSSLQCKIRVSDAADGNPFDISDNNFSIIALGSQLIKVKTPNGTEKWPSGSSQDITWDATGVANVKIEYTINNGISWNVLTASTPSTGIYTWNQIPNTASTNCKIKISDAADGTPFDESDNVFSIVPEASVTVVAPNGGEVWYTGSSKEIKWTSVSIENVKIEYSINGGATWTLIAASVPSVGLYTWAFIPNLNSLQCKIKISDALSGNPYDISDANFTITNQIDQTIQITSPKGGEKWQAGTTRSITWNSQGINTVNIDFTTNGGITWNSIIKNYSNSGTYDWFLPAINSTQCKIRVSDSADNIPTVESGSVFTVKPLASLTIIQPITGTEIFAGDRFNIQWNSSGIEYVRIQVNTKNSFVPSDWITIADSIPNNNQFETTFNIVSDNYVLRIIDPVGGSEYYYSGVFKVKPAPSISVTNPNGGEELHAGASYSIKWKSTNIENVKIEYTSNGGATWNVIVSSTPSNGLYVWNPIPALSSLQCKIRISDAVDSVPSDISDDNFSVIYLGSQLLSVTSPNGGEQWPSGSTQTITWSAAGIANVNIEYTTNNGNTWNTIVSNIPSTGSYTWNQLPNVTSTNCRIRISDAADGSPADISDNLFSITPEPSINVTSPNGGETWLSGTSKEIRWTSQNVANVKIEYTTNGGATWNSIVDSTPSFGFFVWLNVPSVNSLQCKIKISDASDGNPFDTSDDNFSIVTPGNQLVTVTSPNGGENWQAGSSQVIKWDAANIANVKIEYTVNNGLTWNLITASTPSTGFYTWVQVPNTASTNCKVRISDATDGFPIDDSDNFFSIIPEPSIVVVKPNGGETLSSGTSTEIRWTSEYVANVKIEYTTNGGANWTTIISSTPSNGTYLWSNIPSVNSLQCKIKISDADDGNPSDLSDQNFEITNQIIQSLSLIIPNGGEKWLEKQTKNITWTSNGISQVTLQYTTDNGLSWNNIISNLANSGSYAWTIPEGINSTQCKIKIIGVSTSLSDVSDASFTISLTPEIKQFLFPTNGTEIIAGEPVTLVWESTGISKVRIDYNYVDVTDPTKWIILVDSVQNSNSYRTSFTTVSNNYVVRVTATDGSASLVSGIFKVKPAPSIQIISPNGKEQWLVSQQNAPITDLQNYHPYEIRWTATNLTKVKLEWSSNGGGSWYVIPGADSTENDGIYIWAPGHTGNPRPDSSDNCLVRIKNPNGSPSDLSDSVFSIHESKKIRVTSPNSGEIYSRAVTTVMEIDWTSFAVGTVDVLYSLDNGVTWVLLADDIQSTGKLSWNFGNLYTTLGRIKVVDSTDNKIWDVNDIPFVLKD